MSRWPTVRVGTVAVATALVAVLAACGSDSEPAANSAESSAPSSPSTPAAPVDTPELDAIAVVGHSGATGTGTDPNNAYADVPANSWATGDNPEVESVYQRLLATHPALEGHNYNGAVNGTDVFAHIDQAAAVMERSPLPDVVLVQTIDNDEQCDGTDKEHVTTFAEGLDDVITTVLDASEHSQVFLVSQWATVEEYGDAVERFPNAVAANSGTGPCAIFDPEGKPDRAGRKSLQAIVDMYWTTVERVCGRHPRCFTDHEVMKGMKVRPEMLNADYNHLSVAGHREYARLAWAALPDEIKNRP
jgi:hypothetical protein